MKGKSGFTLLELMIALIVVAIGTRLLVKPFLDKAINRADKSALKSLLMQASRKSLTEARHYGIHYDSTTKVVGLFRDGSLDETFNSGDTISSAAKMNPRANIKILNSDGTAVKDVCFKKNGAASTGKSYSLKYKAVGKDSFTLQVIAASGQVLEL